MSNVPASTRQYHLSWKTKTNDDLTIQVKDIEKPKANEVLVKIHAVSLQFRDLMIVSRDYPASYPEELVPCSDMAGEIVELGADVKGWKVGDRVCANFATDHIYGDATPATRKTCLGGPAQGVLTEYRTFPVHSLVHVPDHLSYEEGSTLPCAAVTAYNALFGLVPVKAGDYVLILGTGGVSIFALQFAVASGATVVVTSSSDEKLKIASKLGAKHVVNYNTTPDWEEEVNKITNGVGVDHVIEVGGQGTLQKSMKAVRVGGFVNVIGIVAQNQQGTLDASSLVVDTILKAICMRGIQVGSVAEFTRMIRLLAANPETTRPLIDKVFEFDEAKQAYDYLASQRHVGKIVIKVSRGSGRGSLVL